MVVIFSFYEAIGAQFLEGLGNGLSFGFWLSNVWHVICVNWYVGIKFVCEVEGYVIMSTLSRKSFGVIVDKMLCQVVHSMCPFSILSTGSLGEAIFYAVSYEDISAKVPAMIILYA